MTLKLRQGQVWKLGDEFIRIVRLERLAVDYKTARHLTGPGQHHQSSKKEFCRLLKSATLVTPQTAPSISAPPTPRA